MTPQQTERLDQIRQILGLDDGDYDEHGANRRNSFNRDPQQAALWTELAQLEALEGKQ
jgi:hypothetical protein